MTDPTGVSFLSYKRERYAEARLLAEAQLDHGIPTWQDTIDLVHGSTESELETVLHSVNTANAVLFVTPEVEQAPIIRDVEAPLIFERYRRKDGFFVVPIAGGGLRYDELQRVLGPKIGATDLAAFNMLRAVNDPIDTDFARQVALRVLDHRLREISAFLPPRDPLLIQLSTRSALPKDSGFALRFDLRHRFDGRVARPGAWDVFVLPAFAALVRTIQQRAAGRDVVLSGHLAIPALVALGTSFLTLTGLNVSWKQEQIGLGRDPELWGLNSTSMPSGFTATIEPQAPTGSDLALLVSVTTDVMSDFRRSSEGLSIRAIVSVAPPEPRPPRVELNAATAREIANLAIDALKKARSKYGGGAIHLFLAVPAGVAFMIGQQLNTFGTVQTYEHVPGVPIPYVAAARFMPSG